MGRGQAVKVVTLDILNIFTPSEQVIQILRFTPLQPNRKKIPIKKAENGSIHQVTLVRWTSLMTLLTHPAKKIDQMDSENKDMG